MTRFDIRPSGDSALLVEYEARIDPEINARAIGLAERIQTATIAGVRDVVPTFRSVAVFFDPLRTDVDALLERLEALAGLPPPAQETDRPIVQVPVCYGGELGPDLAGVAAFARMRQDEVVAVHSAVVYRVYCLGFLPGWSYMGTVDARIAMPRRTTPRVRVPCGSVAIAGGQTGIYSTDSPGGWQLVGRTPLKPFDPARQEPFLVKAGDSVRFVPMARDEFDRATAGEPAR